MQIHIGRYTTVKELLEILKREGATEEDYSSIELDLDYDKCYYESDEASICAEWNKKK